MKKPVDVARVGLVCAAAVFAAAAVAASYFCWPFILRQYLLFTLLCITISPAGFFLNGAMLATFVTVYGWPECGWGARMCGSIGIFGCWAYLVFMIFSDYIIILAMWAALANAALCVLMLGLVIRQLARNFQGSPDQEISALDKTAARRAENPIFNSVFCIAFIGVAVLFACRNILPRFIVPVPDYAVQKENVGGYIGILLVLFGLPWPPAGGWHPQVNGTKRAFMFTLGWMVLASSECLAFWDQLPERRSRWSTPISFSHLQFLVMVAIGMLALSIGLSRLLFRWLKKIGGTEKG